MNESFTRFQSYSARRAEEPTSSLLNWEIGLNSRENRRNELFFAEALHQIARARETSEGGIFVDGEDFDKSCRSLSPYRLKLLASAIASCKNLPSERLERQLRSTIAHLAREPRPSHSVELSIELERSDWQARQIELDSWRVLYAVDESAREAIVIAIAPSENNALNLYLSYQDTYLLGDRANLFGCWEYHYC